MKPDSTVQHDAKSEIRPRHTLARESAVVARVFHAAQELSRARANDFILADLRPVVSPSPVRLFALTIFMPLYLGKGCYGED